MKCLAQRKQLVTFTLQFFSGILVLCTYSCILPAPGNYLLEPSSSFYITVSSLLEICHIHYHNFSSAPKAFYLLTCNFTFAPTLLPEKFFNLSERKWQLRSLKKKKSLTVPSIFLKNTHPVQIQGWFLDLVFSLLHVPLRIAFHLKSQVAASELMAA